MLCIELPPDGTCQLCRSRCRPPFFLHSEAPPTCQRAKHLRAVDTPPTLSIPAHAQALTGAFMFTSDLARAIVPVPAGLSVDFFAASSYGASTESDGEVRVELAASKVPVAGRHILVVSALAHGANGLAAGQRQLCGSPVESAAKWTLQCRGGPHSKPAACLQPAAGCRNWCDVWRRRLRRWRTSSTRGPPWSGWCSGCRLRAQRPSR